MKYIYAIGLVVLFISIPFVMDFAMACKPSYHCYWLTTVLLSAIGGILGYLFMGELFK
jgi:hypothetical protein